MSKSFVVAGPATIGNLFGYYGKKVPEGHFAVCSVGEYANGGSGPSSDDGLLYQNEEAAQRAATRLNAAAR